MMRGRRLLISVASHRFQQIDCQNWHKRIARAKGNCVSRPKLAVERSDSKLTIQAKCGRANLFSGHVQKPVILCHSTLHEMITADVPCDSAASAMRESVGAVFRVGRPSVRLETDALNP